MSTALTKTEASTLAECEAIIKRGVEDVGNALKRIRDERLFRGKYDTFDIYLNKTWGWSPRHAQRLIAAAVTVNNLRPTGRNLLTITERQARPLAGLSPEKQAEIWKEITDSTPPEEITEKVVSEHVRRDSGWESIEKRPNYLETFKKLWRECNKQEKSAILKWARQHQ